MGHSTKRLAVKWLAISVAAAGAVAVTPLLARLTEAPDDQGAGAQTLPREDARPGRGEGRSTSRPAGGWRYGGGGDSGQRPREGDGGMRGPTTEQWDEIQAFMEKNTPVRLGLYRRIESESSKEHGGLARFLRARIAGRFRELQQVQERNADVYPFALQQLQIEDNVLGTLVAIRNDGETPELKQKLNGQMHGFVENLLNERAARLDKLKDFVAKEEANLGHDQERVDEMVGRQRERFEKEMKRMIDFAADSDTREPTTSPAK